VINGYTHLLRQETPEEAPHRELLDEVYKAGERAAALTRQLLAFSRKQILAPSVVQLNLVVGNVEKVLRRLIGGGVELATELESSLARVKADQGLLEQVLLNLAVNARDAMPEGGTLTIRTANIDVPAGRRLGGAPPGHYVVLEVSDTGCGMDSSVMA